jgi:hypothetical protein
VTVADPLGLSPNSLPHQWRSVTASARDGTDTWQLRYSTRTFRIFQDCGAKLYMIVIAVSIVHAADHASTSPRSTVSALRHLGRRPDRPASSGWWDDCKECVFRPDTRALALAGRGRSCILSQVFGNPRGGCGLRTGHKWACIFCSWKISLVCGRRMASSSWATARGTGSRIPRSCGRGCWSWPGRTMATIRSKSSYISASMLTINDCHLTA